MVRDTTEGKVNYLNVRFGPMLRRWADHLTKGRVKYPDVAPGTPNWTLAAGVDEYLRAKESAARHFEAWLRGERDEDHASGVFFNVNLAEYVLEKLPEGSEGLGAAVATGPEPITDFLDFEDWRGMCENRGPKDWVCERPLGHAGDHGWSPEANGENDVPPEDTRWPQ